MPLKRDNWTNSEVTELIRGQKLFKLDGSVDEDCSKHNLVVDMLADYFESHFACPDDDFSALSLDTETGEVFHTGTILPR
jgi:hypothetical protein